MAKGFNLTAEINLRGPSNIRTVVADIRKNIGSVSVNITPKVSNAALSSVANAIRSKLSGIVCDVQIKANNTSINNAVSDLRKRFSNINISANVGVSQNSIRRTVSDIRKQLGSINSNINIKFNASTIGTYNTNLSALNNTLNQTAISARDASTAINTLNSALRAASTSAATMNQLSANMTSVGATSRRSGNDIRQATNEIVEFGHQSGLAVRRFAAFSSVTGVIYGMVNAISQGVKAFIDFDLQLTRISQVTGDSKDRLQDITNTISTLSTSLGVSSGELTKATVTLAQAGLSARETEKALKALALSALAPSFDDMNQTVEGSIALMRQFGIGTNQLEGALGSVNAVAAKFAVEASDIITAIQRTGGVFAAASKGVSTGTDALNEFIAVFTSIRATTRESAETIATGLRTIFTRIQRAGTIDALKEFGVNLTDLEGKFVGPYIAVQRLSEGLSRLDPRDLKFSQIVEELGGFRQIGKVLPLIQQFSTAQEALKVAQQGQGSLAEDAAKGQLALAIQIQKVREEFLALVRSVGNTSSFQKMVSVGLDLASALIKVADAAKGLIPLITLFTAFKGISAITQYIGGFGQGIRGQRRPVHEGGRIHAFASGGLVPGSGDHDTVPAMLTPGEFVLNKTATSRAGIDSLRRLNMGGDIQQFAGGTKNKGVTAKPNAGKIGVIVKESPDTQESHVGSLMELTPRQIKAALLKTNDKKIHFKISDLLGEPIKNIDSKAPHIDSQKFIETLTNKEILWLSNEIGLNAQRDIKINLPSTYNQALRRTDPDLVAKKDLIKWTSSHKSLTDPLPKPVKSIISNTEIANVIQGIQPAKSSSETYNQPAYDTDSELDSLGTYINEKYARAGIDPNITFKFRGASKSFYQKIGGYSSKTGGRQDRFNVPQETINVQSGGFIQKLGRGGKLSRKVPFERDVLPSPFDESKQPKLGSNIYDLEKTSGLSRVEFDDAIRYAKTNDFTRDEFKQHLTKIAADKKAKSGLMMNPETLRQFLLHGTRTATNTPQQMSLARSLMSDKPDPQYDPKYDHAVNKSLGGLIQTLSQGGLAQRRVGYIDYDVIANEANKTIVEAGMKKTGVKGPRLYTDHLTQLAVQARKTGDVNRLRAVYGTAGSGKTTLARGQGTDDSSLRQTSRFPVLSPDDIQRATEILVLTSSVSQAKLDEYLKDTDRTYTISSTTPAEKERVRKQRIVRDETGVGLEGRTPGSTAGVATDTAVGEALLANRLGKKSTVLGRTESGRLRPKRGNELVDVVKKKIAFTWGGFAPTTAGHESIMDAASAMGFSPEDFIALVGANEGIKAGDPSSYRTAIFDQDTRVILAKAGFGARGATVLAKPRDFEVPQAFDISGESGRRKVLVPSKGSRVFVADKTPEQTAKYKEAGYSVSSIERTGGISGTMVRDLILSGNMAKLQEVLSPGVYDIISNNIGRLQNRANVLPDIIRQVQQSQELSLAQIDKEIDAIGIKRLDSKKIATDPEYAAKAEQLSELREKKKKIQSAGSFEPYRLLEALARKEPDKYGLDLSTSTRAIKPVRTVSKSPQKAETGGLIRKFASAGIVDDKPIIRLSSSSVQETVQNNGISLQDAILAHLDKLGGIDGVRKAAGIPAGDRKISSVLRRNNVSSGVNLSEAQSYIDKALGTVQQRNNDKQRNIKTSQQKGLLFGAAGIKGSAFPPIQKTISKNLKQPVDVYITSGTLDPNTAVKVESLMDSGIDRATRKVSKRIMIDKILSEAELGKTLYLDFDRTLAFGADKITNDDPQKPKFAAFSNREKVRGGLVGARLTMLGKSIAGLVAKKPDLIPNMRVLTARPQPTLDLIQEWLSTNGLPIPLTQFTGVGGPSISEAQVSKLKAAILTPESVFVDDSKRNIREAKQASRDNRSKIQTFRYGQSAVSSDPNREGTTKGNIFERAIEALGGPKALKIDKGIDFPLGLQKAAKYFGIRGDIPTDAKRTINGPATVEDNIISYLKTQGYNEGGKVQKFASGGLVPGVGNTDTVPAVLGVGDFVIRKSSVAKLGVGNLAKMAGYASGGTADSNVPALLTPGEFVFSKNVAQKIGYSTLNTMNKFGRYAVGGPVKMALGGSAPSARPAVLSMDTIGASDAAMSSLEGLSGVLEALGVRSSAASKLVAKGSQVSYAAIQRAYQQDILRARAARADASVIAELTHEMQRFEQEARSELNIRQQLRDVTGGALQDFLDQVETEFSRLENIARTSFTAANPGATQQDIITNLISTANDRRTTAIENVASTTGVGGVTLDFTALNASGNDLSRVIQNLSRDTNTLDQMDQQYIISRRAAIDADLAAGRITTAEGNRLKNAIAEEIRVRRQSLQEVAKSQGARGPQDRQSNRENLGYLLSFATITVGTIIAQNIDSKSSAYGAAISAGIQGGTTMAGIGIGLSTELGRLANQLSSTGGLLGRVGGAITKFAGGVVAGATVVASLAAGAKDAFNAFKDFQINFQKNKLDFSVKQVSDELERLSRDLNNVDFSRVTSSIEQASESFTRTISLMQSRGLVQWANIFDAFNTYIRSFFQKNFFGRLFNKLVPGQEMQEDQFNKLALILEKLGYDAYTRAKFGGEEGTSTQLDILAPILAKEQAELGRELANSVVSTLREQFKAGQNSTDIFNSDAFESYANALANADAVIRTRILKLENSGLDSDTIAKSRKSIIETYAKEKIMLEERLATQERESRSAARFASVYTRSLSRTFENMEQVINSVSFQFKALDNQLADTSKAFSGMANAGRVNLQTSNIVSNPRGYTELEVNQARTNASAFFGSRANVVAPMLGVSETASSTIMETINRTLEDNASATNEAIIRNIDTNLKQTFRNIGLPPELADRLAKEVGNEVGKMRKEGDKEISFEELQNKVSSLSTVIESASQAQKSVNAALEAYQNMLSQYTSMTDQLIELEVSQREKQRRSLEILVDAETNLNKALNKTINLDSSRARLEQKVENFTKGVGGATSPEDIFKKFLEFNRQRQTAESARNASAERPIAGIDDVIKFNNEVKKSSVALRENYNALKLLAENTEYAADAMSRIQDAQQRASGRVSFIEKLVTSTPEELDSLNGAFSRLQKNMNGQLNTINQSVGAQKAYETAVKNGASAFEAMRAAQSAFANERKETLGLLNEILPFLGEGKEANNIKANVLEGMLRESGMGVSPLFAQVLNSLRNPEADPALAAAINHYQEANQLQATANKYLGLLDGELAQDIANKQTKMLLDGLKEIKLKFENKELADLVQKINTLVPIAPQNKATGGIVYAAAGTMVDFQPKGSDTVPAMLTPGEFVVNRSATQKNLGLLHAINTNRYSDGGKVRYYADGGYVTSLGGIRNIKQGDQFSTTKVLDPNDNTRTNMERAFLSLNKLPPVYTVIGSDQQTPQFDTDNIDLRDLKPTSGKVVPGFARDFKKTSPTTIVALTDMVLKDQFKNVLIKSGADEGFFAFNDGSRNENDPFDTIELNKTDYEKWSEKIKAFKGFNQLYNKFNLDPAMFGKAPSLDSTGFYDEDLASPNQPGKSLGIYIGDKIVNDIPNNVYSLYHSEDKSRFAVSSAIQGPAFNPDAGPALSMTKWTKVSDDSSIIDPTKGSNAIIQYDKIPSAIEFNDKAYEIYQKSFNFLKNPDFAQGQMPTDLEDVQTKLESLYNDFSVYEQFSSAQINKYFDDLSVLTGQGDIRNLFIFNDLAKNLLEKTVEDLDRDQKRVRDNKIAIGLTGSKTGPRDWIVDSAKIAGFGTKAAPPKPFPYAINLKNEDLDRALLEAAQKQQAINNPGSIKMTRKLHAGKFAMNVPVLGNIPVPYAYSYDEWSGNLYDSATNTWVPGFNENNPIKLLADDVGTIFGKPVLDIKNDRRRIYDNIDLTNAANLSNSVAAIQGNNNNVAQKTAFFDYVKALFNKEPDNVLNNHRNNAKNAFVLQFNKGYTKSQKPSFSDADVLLSPETNVPNQIDITEYLLDQVKLAKDQVALGGKKIDDPANLRGAKLDNSDIPGVVRNLSKFALQIFGSRAIPGLSKSWLFSQIGRIPFMKNMNVEFAKNAASYAVTPFEQLGGYLDRLISSNNFNDNIISYLKESWLLSAGAASAFRGVATGNTNIIAQLRDAGSNVIDLFRTLGGGVAIGKLSGLSLNEDWKGLLEKALENGLVKNVGPAGRLGDGEDMLKKFPSDVKGLIDLIFNPYNEFAETSIRSSLIDKFIGDLANFRGPNPTMGPRQRQASLYMDKKTMEWINDRTEILKLWYAGDGNQWLGQDYLYDKVQNPDNVDRAEKFKQSYDQTGKNIYPLANMAHIELGLANKFGPLPTEQYLNNRVAQGFQTGGIVYASDGGSMPIFRPMGTDTVPAMLTPGEFVVNRSATAKHLPLLRAINNNSSPEALSSGGVVYAQKGTKIPEKPKMPNLISTPLPGTVNYEQLPQSSDDNMANYNRRVSQHFRLLMGDTSDVDAALSPTLTPGTRSYLMEKSRIEKNMLANSRSKEGIAFVNQVLKASTQAGYELDYLLTGKYQDSPFGKTKGLVSLAFEATRDGSDDAEYLQEKASQASETYKHVSDMNKYLVSLAGRDKIYGTFDDNNSPLGNVASALDAAGIIIPIVPDLLNIPVELLRGNYAGAGMSAAGAGADLYANAGAAVTGAKVLSGASAAAGAAKAGGVALAAGKSNLAMMGMGLPFLFNKSKKRSIFKVTGESSGGVKISEELDPLDNAEFIKYVKEARKNQPNQSTFLFEAVDANTGKEIRDTVNAATEMEARATIRSMGYMVVKMKKQKQIMGGVLEGLNRDQITELVKGFYQRHGITVGGINFADKAATTTNNSLSIGKVLGFGGLATLLPLLAAAFGGIGSLMMAGNVSENMIEKTARGYGEPSPNEAEVAREQINNRRTEIEQSRTDAANVAGANNNGSVKPVDPAELRTKLLKEAVEKYLKPLKSPDKTDEDFKDFYTKGFINNNAHKTTEDKIKAIKEFASKEIEKRENGLGNAFSKGGIVYASKGGLLDRWSRWVMGPDWNDKEDGDPTLPAILKTLTFAGLMGLGGAAGFIPGGPIGGVTGMAAGALLARWLWKRNKKKSKVNERDLFDLTPRLPNIPERPRNNNGLGRMPGKELGPRKPGVSAQGMPNQGRGSSNKPGNMPSIDSSDVERGMNEESRRIGEEQQRSIPKPQVKPRSRIELPPPPVTDEITPTPVTPPRVLVGPPERRRINDLLPTPPTTNDRDQNVDNTDISPAPSREKPKAKDLLPQPQSPFISKDETIPQASKPIIDNGYKAPRITQPQKKPTLKTQPPKIAPRFATGGIVYASDGQLINFKPMGTDTVPAMLTPGEFVVNASATSQHLPLLKSINSGNYSSGGVVYAEQGSLIAPTQTPTGPQTLLQKAGLLTTRLLPRTSLTINKIDNKVRDNDKIKPNLNTINDNIKLNIKLAKTPKTNQIDQKIDTIDTKVDFILGILNTKSSKDKDSGELSKIVDYGISKLTTPEKVTENEEDPRIKALKSLAEGYNYGGIVYANNGMMIPYQPKGTDTVPAMLTPGEFVINRAATQKHLPLLQAINSGHMSSGGMVYASKGQLINSVLYAEKGAKVPNFAAGGLVPTIKRNAINRNEIIAQQAENSNLWMVTKKKDLQHALTRDKGNIIPDTGSGNLMDIPKTDVATVQAKTREEAIKLAGGDDKSKPPIPSKFNWFDKKNYTVTRASMILRRLKSVVTKKNNKDTILDELAYQMRARPELFKETAYSTNIDTDDKAKKIIDDITSITNVVPQNERMLNMINTLAFRKAQEKYNAAILRQNYLSQIVANSTAAIEALDKANDNNNIDNRQTFNGIDSKQILKQQQEWATKEQEGINETWEKVFSQLDWTNQLRRTKAPNIAYGINSTNIPQKFNKGGIVYAQQGTNRPVKRLRMVQAKIPKEQDQESVGNEVHTRIWREGMSETLRRQLESENRATRINARDYYEAKENSNLESRFPDAEQWLIENRPGLKGARLDAAIKAIQDKNIETRKKPTSDEQLRDNVSRMYIKEYLNELYNSKNPSDSEELGLLAKDEKGIMSWLEKTKPGIMNYSGGSRGLKDRTESMISILNLDTDLDREFNLRKQQQQQQENKLREVKNANNFAKGGVVYAAQGALINYQPRGTDTVPAMLTPGEFVINRQATQQHLPLLKSINSGYYKDGDIVQAREDIRANTKSINKTPYGQGSIKVNEQNMSVQLDDLVQSLLPYTSGPEGAAKLIEKSKSRGVGDYGFGIQGVQIKYMGPNVLGAYTGNNHGKGFITFPTPITTSANVKHEMAHAIAHSSHVGMGGPNVNGGIEQRQSLARAAGTATVEDQMQLWDSIAANLMKSYIAKGMNKDKLIKKRDEERIVYQNKLENISENKRTTTIAQDLASPIAQELIRNNFKKIAGTGYSVQELIANTSELFAVLASMASTSTFGQMPASQAFLKRSMKALGYNQGGIVYANTGMLIPYQPQGTDTVPAMLTPGEFVINRQATQQHLPLLKAINDGSVKGLNKGGIVYFNEGGKPTQAQSAVTYTAGNAVGTALNSHLSGSIKAGIKGGIATSIGSLVDTGFERYGIDTKGYGGAAGSAADLGVGVAQKVAGTSGAVSRFGAAGQTGVAGYGAYVLSSLASETADLATGKTTMADYEKRNNAQLNQSYATNVGENLLAPGKAIYQTGALVSTIGKERVDNLKTETNISRLQNSITARKNGDQFIKSLGLSSGGVVYLEEGGETRADRIQELMQRRKERRQAKWAEKPKQISPEQLEKRRLEDENMREQAISTFNADIAMRNKKEIEAANKELESLKKQHGSSGLFGKYDNSKKIAALESKINNQFMTADEQKELAMLSSLDMSSISKSQKTNPYGLIAQAGTIARRSDEEARWNAMQVDSRQKQEQWIDSKETGLYGAAIRTAGHVGGVGEAAGDAVVGGATMIAGAMHMIEGTLGSPVINYVTGSDEQALRSDKLNAQILSKQEEFAKRGILGGDNLTQAQARVKRDQSAASAFRGVGWDAIKEGFQDTIALGQAVGAAGQGFVKEATGYNADIYRYQDQTAVSRGNARRAKEVGESMGQAAQIFTEVGQTTGYAGGHAATAVGGGGGKFLTTAGTLATKTGIASGAMRAVGAARSTKIVMGAENAINRGRAIVNRSATAINSSRLGKATEVVSNSKPIQLMRRATETVGDVLSVPIQAAKTVTNSIEDTMSLPMRGKGLIARSEMDAAYGVMGSFEDYRELAARQIAQKRKLLSPLQAEEYFGREVERRASFLMSKQQRLIEKYNKITGGDPTKASQALRDRVGRLNGTEAPAFSPYIGKTAAGNPMYLDQMKKGRYNVLNANTDELTAADWQKIIERRTRKLASRGMIGESDIMTDPRQRFRVMSNARNWQEQTEGTMRSIGFDIPQRSMDQKFGILRQDIDTAYAHRALTAKTTGAREAVSRRSDKAFQKLSYKLNRKLQINEANQRLNILSDSRLPLADTFERSPADFAQMIKQSKSVEPNTRLVSGSSVDTIMDRVEAAKSALIERLAPFTSSDEAAGRLRSTNLFDFDELQIDPEMMIQTQNGAKATKGLGAFSDIEGRMVKFRSSDINDEIINHELGHVLQKNTGKFNTTNTSGKRSLHGDLMDKLGPDIREFLDNPEGYAALLSGLKDEVASMYSSKHIGRNPVELLPSLLQALQSKKFDENIPAVNILKKLMKFHALAKGGIVYASNGTLVPYEPKGTDTVPAMLTPGEFVVNRAATQKHLPLLKSINSGNNAPQYASFGGIIKYFPTGGEVESPESEASMRRAMKNFKEQDRIARIATAKKERQEALEARRTAEADRLKNISDKKDSIRQAYTNEMDRRKQYPNSVMRIVDEGRQLAAQQQQQQQAIPQIHQETAQRVNMAAQAAFDPRNSGDVNKQLTIFGTLLTGVNQVLTQYSAILQRQMANNNQNPGAMNNMQGMGGNGGMQNNQAGVNNNGAPAGINIDGLTQFTQKFGEFIGQLQQLNLPPQINIKGEHQVNVVINGASALEGMNKGISDMITSEINKAMNKLRVESEGAIGE